MIDLQLTALLLAPLLGGLLLAAFGSRSWAAELNSLMSFCTFAAAVALTVRVVEAGPQVAFKEQFFIDQFNVFLVALTAFIAFTTSLFSRPYMRIEQDHGRLSTPMLHLYYSMYQLFTLAMLVALTANNMGIIWVAMEAATLTTVLLVSLYRTPASLEAAWKYFILCGVGIAQALFGLEAIVLRWHEDGELRAQVRHLLRRAEAYMTGGYLALAGVLHSAANHPGDEPVR